MSSKIMSSKINLSFDSICSAKIREKGEWLSGCLCRLDYQFSEPIKQAQLDVQFLSNQGLADTDIRKRRHKTKSLSVHSAAYNQLKVSSMT